MKAWQLNDSGPSLTLVRAAVPQPVPAAGEVLIRVHAVSVIPTELGWQPTTHTKTGEERRRAIPGHEFSGTVAAVGENTTGVIVGQEIFGMNDWYADGATADCCITLPDYIAPKPHGLTYAQAASVPISALTAWQGLFDRAKLKRDEHVLIHGGAGSVGAFAIQFAANLGAHVATTASARDKEFLVKLGAEQIIDYHTQQFEDHVKQADVIFDTVGGQTLQRSWKILAPAGRLVTIVSGTADEKTRKAFFIVEPNRAQLLNITGQIENKTIQPLVAAVVPFAFADTAYAGKAKERLGPGKIVVTVIE